VYDHTACQDSKLCTVDLCTDTGCDNSEKICNDDNPCTIDYCSELTGECVFDPMDCTLDSDPEITCKIGVCEAGNCVEKDYQCPLKNCKENGKCSLGQGCSYDDVVCTPTDTDLCTSDECNPDTGYCENNLITCKDSLDCTHDTCDSDTGCVFTDTCYSSTPCTISKCTPDAGHGTCVTSTKCVLPPLAPGQIRQCASVACDNGGCVYTLNHDKCVQDLSLGICQDAKCDKVVGCKIVPLICPDDNDPCTVDSCNDQTGACDLHNRQDEIICNDGIACTKDTCDSSKLPPNHCRHEPDDSLCSVPNPPAKNCYEAFCNIESKVCDTRPNIDECAQYVPANHVGIVCFEQVCKISGCEEISTCETGFVCSVSQNKCVASGPQ